MVQKIHPQVPSSKPQCGNFSEKNDDLAVQYEDCPWVPIDAKFAFVYICFFSFLDYLIGHECGLPKS